MAAGSQYVPEVYPLSESVKDAAIKCGDVLNSRDTWKTISVPSDPYGTCDAWDHGVGENLRHLCASFVDEFPPLKEVRIKLVGCMLPYAKSIIGFFLERDSIQRGAFQTASESADDIWCEG